MGEGEGEGWGNVSGGRGGGRCKIARQRVCVCTCVCEMRQVREGGGKNCEAKNETCGLNCGFRTTQYY